MTKENNSDVPQPSTETIGMVRETAGYVVSRQPMSLDARALLESAVADQHNQVRLVLASIGSHKMKGLADLLKAIDFCKHRMLSSDYLKNLGEDPEELRRHLQVLLKMEEGDVEFLRLMVGEGAEKQGFSGDPKQQYNFFFDQGPTAGTAVLPADMNADSRRKIMGVLEKVLAIGEGAIPTPPSKSTRVIDVEEVKNDRSETKQERSESAGPEDSSSEWSSGDEHPEQHDEGSGLPD